MRISDWSSDVCSSDLRVYSGLLLRVRSEAELAAVLGHEVGHFEKRHSLMQFKAARGGSDLLAWSALLARLSPSYNTPTAYQDHQISVYGSFFHFGLNQEPIGRDVCRARVCQIV